MIKARKDFILDGVPYVKGDEINLKDINAIKKLNEKGFIEPLSFKELVLLERELKKPKKEEASKL